MAAGGRSWTGHPHRHRSSSFHRFCNILGVLNEVPETPHRRRTFAVWAALALLALPAVAVATPRWGTPVIEPRLQFDDVVDLARAADGSAIKLRGKVPLPERVSSRPATARNERGDAAAIWIPDAFPIATYAPSGGGPIERRLLDLESDGGGPGPQLLMNRSGDLLAVWTAKAGTLAVATRVATGWNAPEVLSTLDRSIVTWGASLLDDGTAAVVWVEATSLEASIVIRSRNPATGTWSAPQVLATSRDGFTGLDVRLDNAGGGVAVWRTGDGERAGTIGVSTRASASDVWSVPVIAGKVADLAAPSLSVAAGGNAALAWVEAGTSSRSISVRVRAAGGVWEKPERVGSGAGGAFNPIVNIADAGHVGLAWTRFGEGDLVPVPRARVKLAGIGWLRAQDLATVGPNSDGLRIASAIVVGNDGRALALDATFAFGGQPDVRISEFAESAPQAPRAPVTIRSVAAADVTTGGLLWVRARLSRPVERARMTLQERRSGRWRDVASRFVDGQTVAASIRANGTGRRTFRVRLRFSGGITTSSSVTARTIRPTQRTVAAGREPIDIDRAGNTLWVLSRDGERRLLRPFDATTGRKTGRPVAAGAGTVAIAASGATVWVTDGTRVTGVNARTGRRGTPRRVTADRSFTVTDIATDGRSVWALANRIEGVFEISSATLLVRMDASGRVVRRVKVPSGSEDSVASRVTVGAGGLWITYESFLGRESSVRFDLRTGRFTDMPDGVAVGRSAVWSLGDPIRRLVPEGGPLVRPPLRQVGLDPEDGSVYVPIPLGPGVVGADAIWTIAPGATRLAVRRIDPATARVGQPIPVGPVVPDLPFGDVTAPPRIVTAAHGGAWVSVPALGAVVHVP